MPRCFPDSDFKIKPTSGAYAPFFLCFRSKKALKNGKKTNNLRKSLYLFIIIYYNKYKGDFVAGINYSGESNG